jgi:predicted helicase
VKAIRWASDRIGREGVVALVTNNGFVKAIAADGVRKHLRSDFDKIYILDLGGNVRKNPRLSGTTHNVFGIQVGVSVNIFVRRQSDTSDRHAAIYYSCTGEFWKKEEKCAFLESVSHIRGIEWQGVVANDRNDWINPGLSPEYENLIPVGPSPGTQGSLFQEYSNGIKTNRDADLYNFSNAALAKHVRAYMQNYGTESARYVRWKAEGNQGDYVFGSGVKWSETLKRRIVGQAEVRFHDERLRGALYRPFSQMQLYFDSGLVDRPGLFRTIFPTRATESENKLICLTGPGSEKPFLALAAHNLVDLHLNGAGCSTQCFPFYTYAEGGTHRRENITDWALEQFHSHYHDPSITKLDIFHYIYAVLHHPEYRERYAANLRRELPRIPFAPVSSVPPVVKAFDVFRDLVKAGKRLTEIHVHYEQQPEYQLTKREKEGQHLDYCVKRMRLSKDKTTLIYNDFLTLSDIPKETYDYRLGNRSALEWVVDQYQVSTDKRSGIVNDPNRADDPQYILRLIGQVITVSLETAKIIQSLPQLNL